MAATGRRMATVGASAALLVGAGAGCASESENADLRTADTIEFAATPEYVGAVIDASGSEAYRYSMSMAMSFGGGGIDGEIATGAVNGDEQQMRMDFGEMFGQIGGAMGEEVPPELADAELTMEQITTGDALYIRAPFFAALLDFAERSGEADEFTGVPGGEIFEVFRDLGDGWGYVDLEALGNELPAEAQRSLTGGQTTDPSVFLDMLRETDAVEELGTDEIDGVEVRGLAAEVDLGDLMAASGTDAEDMDVGSVDGADIAAFSFPLEVWVDDDDLVRRIEFEFGSESFAELAEEAGEDIDDIPSGFDFSIGMSMDFTDYGDGSISIEAPDDAVDITDDFTALSDVLGD